MMSAPTATALFISSSLCVSTSASSPRLRVSARSPASCASSRYLTMRSAALAPASFTSRRRSFSEMKSLARSGIFAPDAATRRRSSTLPLNRAASQRTDIAAAPPASYIFAFATGSAATSMSPSDGDARLNSAMMFTPSLFSASLKCISRTPLVFRPPSPSRSTRRQVCSPPPSYPPSRLRRSQRPR